MDIVWYLGGIMALGLIFSLFEQKPQKNHRPNVAVSQKTLYDLSPQQTEIQRNYHIWTTQINGTGVDPNSYWGRIREEVFRRDHNCCTRCGSVINLQVDHVLELSLGGDNSLENLTILCKDCHAHKHSHLQRFPDRNFNSDDNYGKNYTPNKKIAILSSAKQNGRAVLVRYKDRHNVRSVRVIRPKKIFREFNKTYVYAYCELDKDDRLFRISRMTINSPKWINKYIDKPITGASDLDSYVISTLKRHTG